MAALTSRARGRAPLALAWERYADPALWSSWAPQIQRVDTDMRRLVAGGTGTVHAGPLPFPTLPVGFEILTVDEHAHTWSWRVRFGLLALRLEHGVTAEPAGSATWLRVHGPLPVVAAYTPVARFALSRLVAP
jgi:Polyketide cyclase / dehydrase and lipid transport